MNGRFEENEALLRRSVPTSSLRRRGEGAGEVRHYGGRESSSSIQEDEPRLPLHRQGNVSEDFLTTTIQILISTTNAVHVAVGALAAFTCHNMIIVERDDPQILMMYPAISSLMPLLKSILVSTILNRGFVPYYRDKNLNQPQR